jgi:hypothetical protein
VLHVEQELLILPEQLSSPPVFSGVPVVWSLVKFGVSLLVLLSVFLVGHCIINCLSFFALWLLVTTLVSSSFSRATISWSLCCTIVHNFARKLQDWLRPNYIWVWFSFANYKMSADKKSNKTMFQNGTL